MKWRGKISRMGGKYVIVVPKALHEMARDLVGKELIIEIKNMD